MENYEFVNTQELKEKLPTKEIRKIARASMQWPKMSGQMALMFLPSIILGILGVLSFNPYISAATSVISVVWTVVCTCGIMRTFLSARRGEGATGLFCEVKKAPRMLGVTLIKVVVGMILLMPSLLAFSSYEMGMAFGFMDIALIIMVPLALMYVQAEFFVVEGEGVFRSLKLSRQSMKGNKWRMVKTMFPVVLWSMLAGTVASTLFNVYNALGGGAELAMSVKSLLVQYVVTTAVTVPVAAYGQMCAAVFFDEINGKDVALDENRTSENILKENTRKGFFMGLAALGVSVVTLGLALIF